MTATEVVPGPPPFPRATYRLQLNKDFRFDDARRIIPYLASLGISHVYLSPITMARPGSVHGYDVVDHNRFNPEIGDADDFDGLVALLNRHGMGVILDFVPNHMFVGPDNAWWMDILEWGRSSPFASWVDIDWEPLEPSNTGKILLPVMGDHYGAALERGELELRFDKARGVFSVHYFDNMFPVGPRHYPALLQHAASVSEAAATELGPIISDFAAMLRLRGGRPQHMQRSERVTSLKGRLRALAAGNDAICRAIEDALGRFRGEPGKPATFDALHWLLERQSYRLAFWRVAAHEINYRRFFDVNDLAGLRMEQRELFDATHRLVGELLAAGKIQGLRLDHVDGLRNPKQYLMRLQMLSVAKTLPPLRREARARQPLYAVVEKILAPDERLRPDWPVSGTTGYDFMAEVNALFVDPRGEAVLTRFYQHFVGRQAEYRDMVREAKRLIMRETLASELNMLASAFNRIAKRSRHTRDYTAIGLREALEDVIASFPVYRTYMTARGVTAEDRRIIAEAVETARRMARSPDTSIYDFIREVLTLDLLARGRGAYARHAVIDAALKFQQYTSPVMAKAVEDTAFYRYVRFVALNEVGSGPDLFVRSPDAFHAAARNRRIRHPLSLLATATHDHKRGEDVRARLDVLSELPGEWTQRVRRWARFNARWKGLAAGRKAPGPEDEYLFYQTVAGAWPFETMPPDFAGLADFRGRIGAYMLKAAREAKLRTSWAAPDTGYEEALAAFVDAALDPALSRPYLDDVAGLVDRIAPAGVINGLAQTALKLTAPGVPDIYQGAELWDLSLVDPDNRRPVDYAVRGRRQESFDLARLAGLREHWRDGAAKQYLIHRVLRLRRARPALFAAGDYRPSRPIGPAAQNVVGFARSRKGEALVTLVPRLVSGKISDVQQLATCGWEDTRVILGMPTDHGRLRDLLTGRNVAVASDGSLRAGDAFAEFPVAVLYQGPEES